MNRQNPVLLCIAVGPAIAGRPPTDQYGQNYYIRFYPLIVTCETRFWIGMSNLRIWEPAVADLRKTLPRKTTPTLSATLETAQPLALQGFQKLPRSVHVRVVASRHRASIQTVLATPGRQELPTIRLLVGSRR